jgi:hypothetical protein
MGGGLMQLVAYGAQDIYLTGNPQITFFKVVYRRHTNFSMEAIQQTINGSALLAGTSSTGTVTVSRNGDLVHNVYVRCDQDTSNGISGDNLISSVELEIGGQRIDKHTKEWLQVWSELTVPDSKANGYKYLTGGFSNTLISGGETNQQSIMVPLQFWFCRNPGLALPLIALQYHEVKMKFTWGSAVADATNGVGRDHTAATPTVEVWVDYVYLDTDERRRFAQQSHEYLIEQLQYSETGAATTKKIKLNFNHPVKELIWTNNTGDITSQRAKLTLNGHDRFAAQDREYFQIRQPLDHHTSVPGYNIKETERPQPIFDSGQLNLSTALSVAEAPNGTTTVGSHAGDFAIDADAGTETLDGAGNGGGAHIAIYSTSAPTIKVGDCLLLVDYDTAAGAGTVLSEVVTVQAVDNATTTNRYAYRFTNDLQVIPDTGSDAGNLTISLLGRSQDPKSRCSQLAKDVNVYSFALKPEEHQPSGTCNFSRIDSAYLEFSDNTVSGGAITVYAVNYNVLRIMSGMGGLAYSN